MSATLTRQVDLDLDLNVNVNTTRHVREHRADPLEQFAVAKELDR
jgi:hypothetical protein